MSPNRLATIKSVVLIAVAILVLPTFGATVASAQRRPVDDDRDLSKPSKPPREQGVVPGPQQTPANPQAQGRKGGAPGRLVGSPVPGIPVRSDSSQQIIPTQVTAGPISNCAPNGGGGITCNIFETDASGNPSEISNVINLGTSVTGGYLVLKGKPAAPDSDQSQWSDLLVFAPTGGNATTVQMFSTGCNTANPNDRSCFPSFATVSADPDSGFINQTKGAATVFVAGPNIYNIFSVDDNPPNRPFTLATSVGTIDEDSATIVQLRNFTATLLPSATGAVHVRYNITAVDDLARYCPATQSVVRVRFRNTDNAGTLAQVSFDIHATNITAGGNNIVYSFSSNGHGNGSSFTTFTDSPAIDFDFANNIYWIEATILRTNPSALADLGSIQIWESIGTACQ